MKTKEFTPIETETDNLELTIMEAENNDGLSDNSVFSPQDLTVLYNRLSILHRQNTNKWAQRVRHMWVQCGDNNSSFFITQFNFVIIIIPFLTFWT